MSCNVQQFSCIYDEHLFKNLFYSSVSEKNDVLDNNDDLWGVDESSSHSSKNGHKDGAFFPQNALFSLSPFADVLVVSSELKAVFLMSKWDAQDEKLKFTVSCESHRDGKDTITSVICLPVASVKRSSGLGPDWTCVAIGYSTGHVRFFTEKGELLLSQCLYDEPVTKFHYQTSSSFDQAGDLIVIYPSVFATLEGFVLLQTIKACRNQVARVAAGYTDISAAPFLPCKKWKLDGQEELTDCDIIGNFLPSDFTHLMMETIRDGPDGFHKTGGGTYSLVLATGQDPYFGVYHITEGTSQPVLSDVAVAVAKKIKTMLPTVWMPFNMFNKAESEIAAKHHPLDEPATTLYSRCVLLDKARQGMSLVLSPNKQLAAVTDSFGRVVLYDVSLGTVIRMWKGYRDAQCGWIETTEDATSNVDISGSECRDRLTASFLVIYAPKRGILEIWMAQQGPRVAVFDVGKNCRLLYSNYAAMGLNLNTSQFLLYPCCLIRADGTLSSVHAPFYATLREKNSRRLRDLHLLQTLKELNTENVDNIIKILLEMKTAAVREQAMELLINKDGMDSSTLANCVSALKGYLKSMAETDQLDYENKILIQTCSRTLQLLSMFITLSHLNSDLNSDKSVLMPTASPDLKLWSDTLNLPEDDVTDIISVIKLHGESKCRNVCFKMDEMTLGQFLGCFSLCERHLIKTEVPHLPIALKDNLECSKLAQLGLFMFKPAIEQSTVLSVLDDILSNSGINSQSLLLLLLQYWLEERHNLEVWKLWENFYHIFSLLSTIIARQTEVPAVVCWEMAYNILCSSHQIASAFAAAVIVRSIVIPQIQTMIMDGEWETLSSEVTWNLLVKRLEDLLMLTVLLRSNHCPVNFQLSVNVLLEGGQGKVSEIVAEWAVSTHLNHKYILEQSYCELSSSLLFQLRKRFPRSLDPDGILANCCWEHMMQWKKNPDDITHLTSALQYLQHISSSMLKNGVGCMLWKTFVLNDFKGLAALMNKVGKLPKERQCKQELSFSSIFVQPFLDFCSHYLEMMMDLCTGSEGTETIPLFPKDELWSSSSESQGAQALVILATNQKQVDYGLANLHFLLTNILYTVVSLHLKNIRPFTFFDTSEESFFFKDLNTPFVMPQRSLSEVALNGRKKFLQRAVCALVQSIPDSLPPHEDGQWNDAGRFTASKWFNKILEMASGLEVSADEIRQHFVSELYANGHDNFAEETLSSVTDKISMGFQLLHLAGQRIAHTIQTSGDQVNKLANLPPAVSLWLRCLETKSIQCTRFDLISTKQLVGHAINFLPYEAGEYKIAMSLLDVFAVLVT